MNASADLAATPVPTTLLLNISRKLLEIEPAALKLRRLSAAMSHMSMANCPVDIEAFTYLAERMAEHAAELDLVCREIDELRTRLHPIVSDVEGEIDRRLSDPACPVRLVELGNGKAEAFVIANQDQQD